MSLTMFDAWFYGPLHETRQYLHQDFDDMRRAYHQAQENAIAFASRGDIPL